MSIARSIGITLLLLAIALLYVKAQDDQDDIVSYSYFQITSAWYIMESDTLDVTESFSDDNYFAFFIENEAGENFFTIRSYTTNEVFCLGTITLEYSEVEEDYRADVFLTQVYCDDEQQEPAQNIMIENIPSSFEETGYRFYYLWVVFSSKEAMVFLCFDAANIDHDGD